MYDIYGLGNALVDMEYRIDDGFLRRHDIAKGHMTLVEEDRLDALIADLNEYDPERMSGGSAANTVIAAQCFGVRTFYSCKVASDATGDYFLQDMGTAGVDTNANAGNGKGKSGRCLVLVTPDAERSMNTFLGVSSQLSTAEIDEAALARAGFFYVEGYLSSSPGSLEAAVECRQLAEDSGVKTAVSLSDPSMVEFFRDGMEQIFGNGVDHLFCNEEEALSWSRTDRLDIAVRELADVARAVNVTLGARGSLAVNGHEQHTAPGYPVTAVDTNGAGDIYAGACLFGWAAGMSADTAAAFGNFAAANLVQRYGARFRHRSDYQSVLGEFRKIT
ncbi:MAG: adenosine kinase [Pseudomonadales bacterium]|nr:adenosine kinase [Pseudomonadales bacterium]NIX09355.1 adenosine kinase [Pseudomonadales bacterium]